KGFQAFRGNDRGNCEVTAVTVFVTTGHPVPGAVRSLAPVHHRLALSSRAESTLPCSFHPAGARCGRFFVRPCTTEGASEGQYDMACLRGGGAILAGGSPRPGTPCPRRSKWSCRSA